MSDNPYQSPAGTQFADFSADDADVRTRRLGWFVWTILILDSLGCVSCAIRIVPISDQ